MHRSFPTIQALLLAGCSTVALGLAAGSAHAIEGSPIVEGSLIISSSIYDRTQGAVANLQAGVTELANTNKATILAVAGNLYPEVWDNDGPDGSFGVTSEITLQAIEATTGAPLWTRNVPTDEVVTSFSSKSEMALHVTNNATGRHLTFSAYAAPGVGALDVSNSDAWPGQDPTNPVTFAFGPTYAFQRTVVAMDSAGNFSYTPTINYGGNNGRAAILGSNGLYYMSGNANNGKAKTFGPSNGTTPDVTETTGLEAINPINNATSSVADFTLMQLEANSAEVDPMALFISGDKPGKDTNFRSVTEFGGHLFVTKGSGGNGIDTLYQTTSEGLPTVGNAASATLAVVPGFPTDPASDGGNFTPFGIFFANATTLYVADEGSGNATDATSHAGLEKWSLVNGNWQLDYVLQAGLVGVVDPVLNGADGPYPQVTTVGLRNLAGLVRGNQVTLWATTSTSSASGDNGADPNKVVKITDLLAPTTMNALVSQEHFSTVAGPTYGKVFRGVAYAQ